MSPAAIFAFSSLYGMVVPAGVGRRNSSAARMPMTTYGIQVRAGPVGVEGPPRDGSRGSDPGGDSLGIAPPQVGLVPGGEERFLRRDEARRVPRSAVTHARP